MTERVEEREANAYPITSRRFLFRAKLTAALNMPNCGGIHDIHGVASWVQLPWEFKAAMHVPPSGHGVDREWIIEVEMRPPGRRRRLGRAYRSLVPCSKPTPPGPV